jgi:uncharacterized protein YbaR (Trm112 family)
VKEAQVVEDESTLEPSRVPDAEKARVLTLGECAALLASPDTGAPLALSKDGKALVAGDESFPIIDGLPLLFPASVQQFAGPSRLDVPGGGEDALRKYMHISGLKFAREPTNSQHTDINYLKHVYRARGLLRHARGTVLDVGCDSPQVSRSQFPESAAYIGLEPTYEDRSEFRIIGISEFLPFRDESLDNVAILTTLDHALDYHRSVDEAWRVLKPGGTLYLATLIWTHNAELHHDHTHFHHFRDFEILGALRRFEIQRLLWYSWKSNTHRFAWYLSATK